MLSLSPSIDINFILYFVVFSLVDTFVALFIKKTPFRSTPGMNPSVSSESVSVTNETTVSISNKSRSCEVILVLLSSRKPLGTSKITSPVIKGLNILSYMVIDSGLGSE